MNNLSLETFIDEKELIYCVDANNPSMEGLLNTQVDHQPSIRDYFTSTPANDVEMKKRKANTPPSVLNMNFDISGELSGMRESVSGTMDALSDKMKTLIADTKRETLEKLDGLERKVANIEIALKSQGESITALQTENEELSTRNALLDGRLTRVERLLDRVRDDMLDHTARSMQDNLVFYRIAENKPENLKTVLTTFLKTQMNIPADKVEQLHIIRIHRKGTPGQYDRPIIV